LAASKKIEVVRYFSDMQRGVIPIPIVVAVLVGIAALGGTAFVAYQAGRNAGFRESEILTYSTKVVASTTEVLSNTVVPEDKEETRKNQQPADDESKLLGSLKSQIDALKAKITSSPAASPPLAPQAQSPSPSTGATAQNANTITIPSGAIVEVDASGNIVRYISGAPEQTSTTTASAGSFEISALRVAAGTTTGKLVWETKELSRSKVVITGDTLSSKEFQSMAGLSTKHSADLIGFVLKNNATYNYEISATGADGQTSSKKTGTLKLLTRPYADILAEVKPAIELNPDLSCLQLFLAPDAFLVCIDHKAGN